MTQGRKDFITLAIETSCDDTAAAVVSGMHGILADMISSQIDSHSKYGGVVPELASRMHQEAMLPLVESALAEAEIKDPASELSLIAVTSGPGLIGSLMVGVMTAKALSQGWRLPLIGVNHLEGHIFANAAVFEDLVPPFISLIVSGGHTEVVLVREFGNYELLGTTRDDAAGEAYDKVSKLLGLGYPGGPVIDRLAAEGDPFSFAFPVPLSSTDKVEFSFSGLKTGVAAAIEKELRAGRTLPAADICASFQRAAVESLMGKTDIALRRTGVKRLAVSGGVAANSALRSALEKYSRDNGIRLFLPPRRMCTDNAVMIAAAGYSSYMRGNVSDLRLAPDPSWSIW